MVVRVIKVKFVMVLQLYSSSQCSNLSFLGKDVKGLLQDFEEGTVI